MIVFHGAVHGVRSFIEEHGIRPANPRSGVRVRTSFEEAVDDARAVAAHYWIHEGAAPQGLVAFARVDKSRLWTRHEIPRINRLTPEEIVVKSPINFPEFEAEIARIATEGGPVVYAPDPEGNPIDRALDHYLKLAAAAVPFDAAKEVS